MDSARVALYGVNYGKRKKTGAFRRTFFAMAGLIAVTMLMRLDAVRINERCCFTLLYVFSGLRNTRPTCMNVAAC